MTNDNFLVAIGAFIIFFVIIFCTLKVIVTGVKGMHLKKRSADIIKVVTPNVNTIEEKVVKTLADGRQIISSTKQKVKNGFTTTYYAKKQKRSFLTDRAKERYDKRREEAVAKAIFKDRMKNGESISGTIHTSKGEYKAPDYFKRHLKDRE